jgi:hypothetical protein
MIANSLSSKQHLLVMPAAEGLDIQKLLETGKATADSTWHIVERVSEISEKFKNKWGPLLSNASYYRYLEDVDPHLQLDFIHADLIGNITPELHQWFSSLKPHPNLDLWVTFSSLIRGNQFFKSYMREIETHKEFLTSTISCIERNKVDIKPSYLRLVAAQWLLLKSALPQCDAQCLLYRDKASMFVYHMENFSNQKNDVPNEIHELIREHLNASYAVLLNDCFAAQTNTEVHLARKNFEKYLSDKAPAQRDAFQKKLRQDLEQLHRQKLKHFSF